MQFRMKKSKILRAKKAQEACTIPAHIGTKTQIPSKLKFSI
jgi:hypothetical protein